MGLNVCFSGSMELNVQLLGGGVGLVLHTIFDIYFNVNDDCDRCVLLVIVDKRI